jgi:peptide chain release factor
MALANTLTVLARDAEAAGLTFDVATGPDPDGHGPASAIALLEGADAEAFAASWVGSVLWVVRSPLRPHHKRKNWFVGIFNLGASPPAPVRLDPADVRFETFRAGGPGGQHQNKTESAVRAVHRPTGLAVVVREGRSQHHNRSTALKRLAAILKLGADVAAMTERHKVQSVHERLERGRPIRTFHGVNFLPR